MLKNQKCWKMIDQEAVENQTIIHIGMHAYTLQRADQTEIAEGNSCLNEWQLHRQYEVQLCGPGSAHPYYEWRWETKTIPFENLIFAHGECIGIYYDECLMLFDHSRTHLHKRYLGEIPLGPESVHEVYEYYCLKKIR